MGWSWSEGFLGTRGSFMLDAVALAMVVLLPVLAVSLALARTGRHYALHKRIQIILTGVLAITVTLFEVDLRWFTDWRARASLSPYYDPQTWNLVSITLTIHLLFALPTALLWAAVVIQALRRFPVPPLPGPHSRTHRRSGWLAAGLLAMTVLTGWVFYWLAFVAEK
ncbi:MAG: DUF420 domain-containing protein [Pirellulaceae bacterium]